MVFLLGEWLVGPPFQRMKRVDTIENRRALQLYFAARNGSVARQ
jgi:hypothetical protein